MDNLWTMAAKRSRSASLHIQWIPLLVFTVITFLAEIPISHFFTIPVPHIHEASCRCSIQSQSSWRQGNLLHEEKATDKNDNAKDVNDKDNDQIQDPKFLKRNKYWVDLVDDEQARRFLALRAHTHHPESQLSPPLKTLYTWTHIMLYFPPKFSNFTLISMCADT
jgi:hypothetical protein